MSRDILGEGGLKVLESYMGPQTLFAFDFDGTLSPIVRNHEKAIVDESVAEFLVALNKQSKVLILTGRDVGDVKKRLPEDIDAIIGNHGVEGNLAVTDEARKVAEDMCIGWESALRRMLADKKFFIENKKYSIAIHSRRMFFKNAHCKDLLPMLAALEPQPVLTLGKALINITTPSLPNKYDALHFFMQQGKYRKAIFVGDDKNDECIFQSKNHNVLSVKVGRWNGLSAPWHLSSQGEMAQFLKEIMAIYQRRNHATF